MNLFSKLRHLVQKIWNNIFSIFQVTLIALLISLVVIFVVVMFSENPKWIFDLLGVAEKGEPKYEVLKFLGIGMGGILVALQALMSYKRAKAMEDTANAQARATEEQAKANQHTEQGQRQDRLKNGIEHLGHESDSVRLGGAYELFHLVEDAENEELRPTVFDILCTHIRMTTDKRKYRETYESKPSAEVQTLLTLLFVQNHEVFKGLPINLEGSWLNGVDLSKAHLRKAVLTQAHLQGANLSRAHLKEANLHKAHLQGTILAFAKLQGSLLGSAQMQGANLSMAKLQGAKIEKVYLQGANLFATQLQGATLTGTKLQGIIRDEGLSSVSFEDCIKKQVGEETDFFSSEVIFSGGLTQEDVNSLAEGLSHEKANELRNKLESHIGQPTSYELPEDSYTITEPYTKEDAEEWIAEYNEAMSFISREDAN